jgi:hypothetical protein
MSKSVLVDRAVAVKRQMRNRVNDQLNHRLEVVVSLSGIYLLMPKLPNRKTARRPRRNQADRVIKKKLVKKLTFQENRLFQKKGVLIPAHQNQKRVGNNRYKSKTLTTYRGVPRIS